MPRKTKIPTQTALLQTATDWFTGQGWTPFPFQKKAWRSYLKGESGLVNAPTGSGKTYSLIIPIFLEWLRDNADKPQRKNNGLQAIWITPIRALTREIQTAAQRAADDLGLEWQIAIRSGDTSSSERTRQRKKPPELLITTPESLHLLLAGKDRDKTFSTLKCLVADEWHELIGSKRGVLIELALSRLRTLSPGLKTWGISATIGNLEEAQDILLGKRLLASEDGVLKARSTLPLTLEEGTPKATSTLPLTPEGGTPKAASTIRAKINKKIEIKTVLPDEIETFPWAGHLGIKLLEKVVPIIHASTTTLIFTNTRAQCEIWYQRLLEADPDLAGAIAMHHGSIDRELRDWVEDALHTAQLKAVVCTSSLDLGVDFRPVETIVQIGSPKGVARFLQRAGRSGHQPGATSVIHFVPTNTLEIIEAVALRFAQRRGSVEARMPYLRSFDVLVQYLVTLAVGGDGLATSLAKKEIRQTYSFSSITDEEFAWCIDFITHGGNSLGAYDEYHKVVREEVTLSDGTTDYRYRVTSKRIAQIHRLGIGAIVSMSSLKVKYLRGGYIGNVEEYFIAQLKPGDTFWFAGRSLQLVKVQGMEALVKKSKAKKGKIPSWQGGRMSLSNQLSSHLREAIDLLHHRQFINDELRSLEPLVDIQAGRSAVPNQEQFLIEYFEDREGYHLLMYPFEGRAVHEGLSALIAYRLGQIQPISFTIAMNDYGFELLSDQPIPIQEALGSDLFNTTELERDIRASINATELARRRFRDIASIAGLVFKGFPGKWKKEKHLQSSSALFFDVFSQYEPDNLLLQQAYEEVMTFQLQEDRLRAALDRINGQYWLFERPGRATPFSFSLIVDRLREKMSSEKLADRIKRMKLRLVS